MIQSIAFKPLERSFKGAFPFRLATTSFIYPDDYLPNVERLGPFFDEIELLFMETVNDDLAPLKQTIKRLGQKAEELDLTYNIHLPIDTWLGRKETQKRKAAADAVSRVIDLTLPLDPTTFTLHLDCNPKCRKDDLKKWQETTFNSISRIISNGIAPSKLTIETLDYPFKWAAPIVTACDLRICMDIGHLMVHEQDPWSFFKTYENRIDLIHLHGVNGKKDHLPLDAMNRHNAKTAINILKKYHGTVSVEVFSYPYLSASLKWLEKMWPAL